MKNEISNQLPNFFCFFFVKNHPQKDEIKKKFNDLIKSENKSYDFKISAFYGINSDNKSFCVTYEAVLDASVIEITTEDFLNSSKLINQKKLIGYRRKSFVQDSWIKSICTWTQTLSEVEFLKDSFVYLSMVNAGILDIWFDEIYEEEKKVCSLNSENGSFELIISKDGIYYEPEEIFLNVETLQSFCQNTNLTTNTELSFSCNIDVINLGCKKKVPIEDLREVINEYKKMISQ